MPPPHARFESGHGAWPSVRVETASYPHGRTRCFSPRHSAHSPFFSPARAHRPLPQPTRPFHSSCSRVPPLPAQCKPVAHPVLPINGYPSASLAHHLFTCSGGKIAASKIRSTHSLRIAPCVRSATNAIWFRVLWLSFVVYIFQKRKSFHMKNENTKYLFIARFGRGFTARFQLDLSARAVGRRPQHAAVAWEFGVGSCSWFRETAN